MTDYADIRGVDVVLEIGAGLGFLTRILSGKAGRVLAVEVDRVLAEVLKKKFGGSSNVEVIVADYLKARVGVFSKVVSNPPYSASSRIASKLLEEPFRCAVVTLQKEFVERLVAEPGSENYGPLSVLAYVKWGVEVMEEVSRRSFYPPPKVTSTVLRITPIDAPFDIADWAMFKSVVGGLFTQRRREVRRALKTLAKLNPSMRLEEPALMSRLEGRRVSGLTPEELGMIVDGIRATGKDD